MYAKLKIACRIADRTKDERYNIFWVVVRMKRKQVMKNKREVQIMSDKDECEITRLTFTEKVIRKGEEKKDEKEKE